MPNMTPAAPPSPARRRRRAPRARRATVYVLVLGVSAIAVAAGIGGLYVQRSRLRMARSATEIDRARLLATSGLEHALARIDADASWRTTLGAGTWLNNHTLGTGALTVTVADPIDAAITDDPLDPILVTSVGVVGSSRQGLKARINMQAVAHTALACGAYGGALVHFNLAAVDCNGPIASGANMTALLANVRAPVEAAGTVSGLTYHQAQTSNATPRTAPTSGIADEWAARGATINYASITSKNLRRQILAPSLPPYGGPSSAQGIYVVDCGGSTLTISETRIYGTLIVLNASSVTVSGSVRIDPATPGWPSLIVEGNLNLQVSTATLKESSNSTNFNPNQAPWLGSDNGNQNDTYPSGLTGIVLATGNIANGNALTMTGCLIALGNLNFNAGATITTDPNLTSSPAPGFYNTVPTLATTGVERVTY